MFGYQPQIFYPKRTQKDLYMNLVKQCELCGIPFLTELPDLKVMESSFAMIVDALFGFSFKPPVRSEFISVLNQLANTKQPVVSIDIPSGKMKRIFICTIHHKNKCGTYLNNWLTLNEGWDVESGPVTDGENCVVTPEMLISLTAPKKCAQHFKVISLDANCNVYYSPIQIPIHVFIGLSIFCNRENFTILEVFITIYFLFIYSIYSL